MLATQLTVSHTQQWEWKNKIQFDLKWMNPKIVTDHFSLRVKMFFAIVANDNIMLKVDARVYMLIFTQKQVKCCTKGQGPQKKIQYGHWCVVVFWLKIALSFTTSVSRRHTPVILVLQKKLMQWQPSTCIQPWNILHSREIHMLLDYPVKAKPQSSTANKRQTGREVCQHYPLTFFIKPHNLPAFSTLLSSLF